MTKTPITAGAAAAAGSGDAPGGEIAGDATGEAAVEQWRLVDEGWGRKAVDFATIAEPASIREYVAVHHLLGVGPGDRLLDVACGSGLALELAGLRGAVCAGIDASRRLLAVAQDRNPDADLRLGDMNALPWEDNCFDVVTSFRGIWATTPLALAEAYRVLTPGGRVAVTAWGHIKASEGAWVLSPLALATEEKVQNQAAMVTLGRPGAGEALLEELGFIAIERVPVPFVFEFADPDAYARALASSGPGFEAIQAIGEDAFREAAFETAQQKVREGLPLRASVDLVGYIAAKPSPSNASAAAPSDPVSQEPAGFLSAPPDTAEARKIMDDDVQGLGYVMNASRLWAHLPSALDGLSDLMAVTTRTGSLTFEQRAVLVTAMASTLGDSYCSMAWGKKLASASSPDVAAAVLGGASEGLGEAERALATWARQVVKDPNAITAGDVQVLRDAGFDDTQIFAITAYVAFRLAFSTVNDALGATPDVELGASIPDAVRSAISFGRPVVNPAD
jgi:SAM-dependent methyltransferase/alkylhydroperoxidase family enzyme